MGVEVGADPLSRRGRQGLLDITGGVLLLSIKPGENYELMKICGLLFFVFVLGTR